MFLNDFPTEILNQIFTHLSFIDLSYCANVCQRWNSIIINYNYLSTFNIEQEMKIPHEENQNASSFHRKLIYRPVISNLFTFVPNLKYLRIIVKKETEELKIAKQLLQVQGKTLEKIIVDSPPYSNDQPDGRFHDETDLIHDLTDELITPNLRELILNARLPIVSIWNEKSRQIIRKVTIDVGHQAPSNCWSCYYCFGNWLKVFKMCGGMVITDNRAEEDAPFFSISRDVQIDSTNIKSFPLVEYLSLRTNIFENRKEFVDLLLKIFPNIKQFELETWTEEYSCSIDVIVDNLINLEYLKVRVWWCCGYKYQQYSLEQLYINDNIVYKIISKLPKLLSIDLEGHLEFSDTCLETLNNNKNLQNIILKHGGIAGHKINDKSYTQPIIHFSENALIEFAKNHPLLEQLEMNIGQSIVPTIEFLTKFIQHCPKLKILKLYVIEKDVSLLVDDKFKTSCTQLETFYVGKSKE
ncbi:unnamed protein product [Didymodactylos carnosus]|uniref:F-box domain-containing protein n=1 Tax=Didymodactylos carnosus TaxID=1234261 RepID=A0A814XGD3_9BILA|nr:unnamed protein product [Didymodactylos carnosus]CAF1216020.1 unnamed protein product [Didymodactylos carnosus]CAF3793795.1 unnamed protein product [Didymodactylos carnosus]CAF3979818.1 unnamed protein product [Didymodactylos carnosus]